MRIENITKKYGSDLVLNGFSAEIRDGITLITGNSGVGKTTLMRILAGLEKPDSGEIKEGGKVSFLFQEDRLFSHLTAKQNVELVCNDGEKAEDLLISLSLGDALEKYPDEMSGGMKRRVAIARALSFESDVYIFDEPLKGLDTELKKDVARLMIEKTRGKPVIIVTHEKEDFSFVEYNEIKL